MADTKSKREPALKVWCSHDMKYVLLHDNKENHLLEPYTVSNKEGLDALLTKLYPKAHLLSAEGRKSMVLPFSFPTFTAESRKRWAIVASNNDEGKYKKPSEDTLEIEFQHVGVLLSQEMCTQMAHDSNHANTNNQNNNPQFYLVNVANRVMNVTTVDYSKVLNELVMRGEAYCSAKKDKIPYTIACSKACPLPSYYVDCSVYENEDGDDAESFLDEQRRMHVHDDNEGEAHYECANKHASSLEVSFPCPVESCEWNLKKNKPEEILKVVLPPPPPTTQ